MPELRFEIDQPSRVGELLRQISAEDSAA